MNVFSKSGSLGVSPDIVNLDTSQLTPVNHTRSLRCLRPISDSPLPHLVRPRCKEAAKIQHLPHRNDDLGQCRLRTELFAFLLRLGLSLETC